MMYRYMYPHIQSSKAILYSWTPLQYFGKQLLERYMYMYCHVYKSCGTQDTCTYAVVVKGFIRH